MFAVEYSFFGSVGTERGLALPFALMLDYVWANATMHEPLMTSPFLARFAVPRTPSPLLPGSYSRTLDMWAEDQGAGLRPLIESRKDLAELTTKTKVNQESDDVEVSLLEITTKTASAPERDDQPEMSSAALLEVTTKTDAQMERDDTSPSVQGFL